MFCAIADCKNAWCRFAWYASMLSPFDPLPAAAAAVAAVDVALDGTTPRPATVNTNPMVNEIETSRRDDRARMPAGETTIDGRILFCFRRTRTKVSGGAKRHARALSAEWLVVPAGDRAWRRQETPGFSGPVV